MQNYCFFFIPANFLVFFFKKFLINFAYQNSPGIQFFPTDITINKLRKENNRHSKLTLLLAVMLTSLAGVLICGCSTGIEGTKRIRMSKDDMKLLVKTDEQNLASSISGTPLSQWKPEKEFIATSDRSLYVFEPSDMGSEQGDIKGDTLRFSGIENVKTPDLKEECVILFVNGNRPLRYRTGKTEAEAMAEIYSSKLPLLSDIELIDRWREKITGMTLWTRSNLWYDTNGNRTGGLKFEKVTVEDVLPTTGDFPMKVKIKDGNGKEAYMNMNYTSDLADSRDFAALFYLDDPKKKYPQISDEIWNLIKQSRIGLGMTKEECRLSLGNPDELDAGHNTSHTMDIWQYTNGTYLIFSDGILTRFRQ